MKIGRCSRGRHSGGGGRPEDLGMIAALIVIRN